MGILLLRESFFFYCILLHKHATPWARIICSDISLVICPCKTAWPEIRKQHNVLPSFDTAVHKGVSFLHLIRKKLLCGSFRIPVVYPLQRSMLKLAPNLILIGLGVDMCCFISSFQFHSWC